MVQKVGCMGFLGKWGWWGGFWFVFWLAGGLGLGIRAVVSFDTYSRLKAH
jgi:hypothetical protein